MKKFLLGCLIGLLGAALLYVVLRAFGDRPGDGGGIQPTAVVVRRDISSSVLATGIIKPMLGAEVQVGSRISGVVRRLHAQIGEEVARDQLLAELDATELQAKLDQAKAALSMTRAELDFAERDLRRQRGLSAEEVIALEELEAAEKAYRLAQLKVAESEANVQYAQVQLGYTQIRAPIAGVVASVATQEGETVAASFATPTFMTIIDLDRLELWAYVDETDIGRVEKKQRVLFTVDTYPDSEFAGEVLAIHPDAVIQNTVVNYVTVISIGGAQGRTLRPEMTANVTIFLDTRENVLAVPRQAVRRDQGRYLVTVIAEDRIEEREVQVGWRDDSYTEITAGLQEGEAVLIGEP